MVFYTYLGISLAPFREVNGREKLAATTSYDLEHGVIVGSKDMFDKHDNFCGETPLEESYHKEIVDVVPYEVELIDHISVESPNNPNEVFSVTFLKVLVNILYTPNLL